MASRRSFFGSGMDPVSWGTGRDYDETARINELHNLFMQNKQEEYDFVNKLNEARVAKERQDQKKLVDEKVQLLIKYSKKEQELYDKVQKAKTAKDKKNAKKELDEFKKELNKKQKLIENSEKASRAKRNKEELAEQQKQLEEIAKLTKKQAREVGISDSDLKQARKATFGSRTTEALKQLNASINNLLKLDTNIETIAKYQSRINTRLQGSTYDWRGLSTTASRITGLSPYLTQESYYSNIDKLIDKGIAFNIDQRAFLATISDKIATTFDAFDSNLLNLIRIQQSDTTAARLGMEASLTKYFNSAFQSTEYLSDAFDSVSSALYGATSLLSGQEGVNFEYQIQKWLGSLYSVGMSQAGVQSIANALNMLATGDITGLAGNTGLQNLLVMASNRSGLSYSEMLTNGINDSELNSLMQSMVEYLAEIAQTNNLAVRAQYANVFGMSISDLKAASNLSSSLGTVSGTNLNYSGAIKALSDSMSGLGERMSVGEMMSNIFSNLQYQMAQGIATSPALYGVWKTANMLESVLGGMSIPTVYTALGGIDLGTTVAQLMKTGALGGSILSMAGNLISSLSTGMGFDPSGLLQAAGIDESLITTTAIGQNAVARGRTKSSSQYTTLVGNVSESAIKESAYAEAESQRKEIKVASDQEEDEVDLNDINNNIVSIYELLREVVSGTSSLKVEWANTVPGINQLYGGR